MHGLPRDIDLSFLKNRMLESVCFGAYQVNLHFDDKVTIMVLGAFRHNVAGESSDEKLATFPLADSRLMRLLTQTVEKVQGQVDGQLELVFSAGDTLIIYDETKQYESYHIKHGDRLIIV